MAKKGELLSLEHRKKISENHADVSGKNNPMWGKKRPKYIGEAVAKANRERKWKKESLLKISEAHRGRKQSQEWISKRIKRGKDVYNWKGSGVGYKSLHAWLYRNYDAYKKCDFCGITDAKRYHWANKSRKYFRDRKDWFRLCVSCHHYYDKLT